MVMKAQEDRKWCSKSIKDPKFSKREAILLFQYHRQLVFKWIRHFSQITTAFPEQVKWTQNLNSYRRHISIQIKWEHNNKILPWTRPYKLFQVATIQKKKHCLWTRHSKLKWTAPLRMDLALWLLLSILKL